MSHHAYLFDQVFQVFLRDYLLCDTGIIQLSQLVLIDVRELEDNVLLLKMWRQFVVLFLHNLELLGRRR